MIARMLVVAGAAFALLTASWGGLVLFLAGFGATLAVVSLAHRGRYRR